VKEAMPPGLIDPWGLLFALAVVFGPFALAAIVETIVIDIRRRSLPPPELLNALLGDDEPW
jgi:hypothetical protein